MAELNCGQLCHQAALPGVPTGDLPIVAASQEHMGIFGVVLQGDKRRRWLQDNFRLVGIFYKAGKEITPSGLERKGQGQTVQPIL